MRLQNGNCVRNDLYNEDLAHEVRAQIIVRLSSYSGVESSINKDGKAHIFIVKYSPKDVTGHDLLQLVLDTGVQAKMLGQLRTNFIFMLLLLCANRLANPLVPRFAMPETIRKRRWNV